MADEVKAPAVTTPAEAPAAPAEKKPARGRKKGSAAKTASAKKAGTKAARKPAAKAEKKPAVKAAKPKASAVQELNFKALTFEYNDKKYSEKDLYDRVKAYISSHPYIVAHDIEIFVKPQDGCAYFTLDGFSNPDFKLDL